MTGGREEDKEKKEKHRGGEESLRVCVNTEWTEDSTSLGSRLEKVVEQTGD